MIPTIRYFPRSRLIYVGKDKLFGVLKTVFVKNGKIYIYVCVTSIVVSTTVSTKCKHYLTYPVYPSLNAISPFCKEVMWVNHFLKNYSLLQMTQFSILYLSHSFLSLCLSIYFKKILYFCVHKPLPNTMLLLTQTPARGTEWETEKAFMLCKHYSIVAKTLLCYQNCFGHKYKVQPIIWVAMKKINAIPTRPITTS